jgi:hypothetical protein
MALYPILSHECGVVPRMIVRLVTTTALVLGVLAAPAAAAALDPLKPCYVSAGRVEDRREGIDLHGVGFTPGAPIDVYIDGVPVISGQADVVGDVVARVPAPYQSSSERDFTLTVAERDNPANVVTATSRVTALRVTLRPRQARPSQRVRYRGRGFTASGAVFAHYVFGGTVRKTVRLARQPGPCGAFDVRRKQIPIRQPRIGNWTVQIDQQESYEAEPSSNWVRMLITVRQVFRDPDE